MIFYLMASKSWREMVSTTLLMPWEGWPTYGEMMQRRFVLSGGWMTESSDQKVLSSSLHFRLLNCFQFEIAWKFTVFQVWILSWRTNYHSCFELQNLNCLYCIRLGPGFAWVKSLLTDKWRSWLLFWCTFSSSSLLMRRTRHIGLCSPFTWIRGFICTHFLGSENIYVHFSPINPILVCVYIAWKPLLHKCIIPINGTSMPFWWNQIPTSSFYVSNLQIKIWDVWLVVWWLS